MQPYPQDRSPVESALIPLPPEEEHLSPLPESDMAGRILAGDIPGRIDLPDEVLAKGLPAVLKHLIPGSTGIIARSAHMAPQEVMRRLGNRIQTLMEFEKLDALELGQILWFIRQEKRRWNVGGSAYKSFREWVECSGFPMSYGKVDEYIRFYELFCRVVESRLNPLSLLSPKDMTPYKRGLIEQQIEQMDGKIQELDDDPTGIHAAQTVRSSVLKEIERIVDTPDPELQAQEQERRYPAVNEEMQPLNVYHQVHLQPGALVWDHAVVPLTREAFAAWRAGQIKRRFQVRGVPDAMTMEQLEEYLEEHDLFVEEPMTVEADREDEVEI